MPSNRDPDDPTRAERTPFNIRADYRESDLSFRERLDTLLPSNLSDRVKKIIEARFSNSSDDREAV